MAEIASFGVNVDQNTRLAQNAQDTANKADTGIGDLNDPNLMSVIEKQTQASQYAGLTSQYNVILARAKEDNISATALTTAYTNLNTFMAAILTDTTKASGVNRDTYKSLTDAYNMALSNVQTSLGDSYNADIDNMQSSVSVASQAASSAVIVASQANTTGNNASQVASQAVVVTNEAKSAGNNATSVANNASQAASDAILAGSTATVNADKAIGVASQAQTTGDNATSVANNASQAASSAVIVASQATVTGNQASTAASDASVQASVAISNANAAQSSAMAAVNQAGFASDTSLQASQAASSALASAMSAESNASSAVSIASSTASGFGKVDQKADSAFDNAMNAQSAASDAVEQASSATTDSKDAKQIAGAVSQSYKTLTDGSTMTIAELENGLAAKLTKTDLDGYATQTWTQNKIKVTADDISGNLSSVKKTVDGQTTSINDLKADSSGFKSQFTKVNNTLGKQNTDIGTLQATSKSLSANFDSLSSDNKTNQHDIGQLQASAKGFSSTLETVQTQVQNSAVGTNLLLGTKYFDNLSSWADNSNWNIITDTYNGLSIVQANQDWSGLSQYNQVSAGETYTFSMYARYVSGTGTSTFYTMLNNNPENGHTAANTSPSSSNVSLTSDWQRVSITFTITSDGWIKPRIERTNNNTNTLQICGMKLEKGSLATDWCPNPADNATVTALTKVKQTADGAEALATNNKGDITSIQETAKGLQSSVKDKVSSSQLTQLSGQLTNQITTASNDASSEMIQTINNASIGFGNADGTSYSINLSADGTALMDVSKLIINGQTSIMDATIGTAQIADLAVTNAQIGNEAVGTAQIADLAVNSAKIAKLAVGTAQIGDGAITNAKIGKLAVGTAQIANAAITDAQIGNISANHLTAGTIDFNTITGKNINASNITTGTLSTDRLNVGKLSALSANLGDVTTGSLKGVDIVAKTFSTPNGSFTTDASGAITAKNMTLTGGTLTSPTINASTIIGSDIQAAMIHSADNSFSLDGATGDMIGASIGSSPAATNAWNISKEGKISGASVTSSLIDITGDGSGPNFDAENVTPDTATGIYSRYKYTNPNVGFDVNGAGREMYKNGYLVINGDTFLNRTIGDWSADGGGKYVYDTMYEANVIKMRAYNYTGSDVQTDDPSKTQGVISSRLDIQPSAITMGPDFSVGNPNILINYTGRIKGGLIATNAAHSIGTTDGGDLYFMRMNKDATNVDGSSISIHANNYYTNNMGLSSGHVINSHDGGDVWLESGWGSGGNTVDLHVKKLYQSSLLSLKTDIKPIDPHEALTEVVKNDVMGYHFKNDKTMDPKSVSVILDDINPIPKYYTSDVFKSADGTGRNDGTIVGYLMLSIKDLNSRLQKLEGTN